MSETDPQTHNHPDTNMAFPDMSVVLSDHNGTFIVSVHLINVAFVMFQEPLKHLFIQIAFEVTITFYSSKMSQKDEAFSTYHF